MSCLGTKFAPMVAPRLRKPRVELPPAPETEIAWAAGFFDGEGCVTGHVDRWGGNVKKRVSLNVGQSGTVEHLLRFQAAVGIGNINGPYNQAGRQPIWHWKTSGKKAHAVMERLRPYLCSPKLAKYDDKFRSVD